jgi:hypothetical protein
MKMNAPLGEHPSDTFHASMGSHGTMLAGKTGNTHVVPPKCQTAAITKIYM